MARITPQIVTRAMSRVVGLFGGTGMGTLTLKEQQKERRKARAKANRQARKAAHLKIFGRRPVQICKPFSMDRIAKDIAAVEAIICYKFKNPRLCFEALTTKGEASRSSASLREYMTPEGNKRLALVGDAWLKVFTVSRWYRTTQTCGEESRMSSILESNDNLEQVGYFYGLDKYINGEIVTKSVADTVEALIGAVVEDGGQSALHKMLEVLGLLPKMDGAGKLSTILHI